MQFKKEYYKHPYYFFLREGKDTIDLYFSVSNTLTEARKKDEKMSFKKKDKEYIEKELTSIFKEKKDKDTDSVKKRLSKMKSEIDELVDYDGSFLSSKIPILNPKLAPKGTTDQEVVQNRQTINPLTRGVTRVYWGESEDEDGNVISEVNMEDAFGYEETKDMTGPETFKTYLNDFDLPAEEAADRTRKQGKEPNPREHKKKLKRVPKSIKKKKNFIDRLTLVEKAKIDEMGRQKIEKMVEDMLLGNKTGEPELTEKNQSLSKLLTKNLESIKKIAEKEGISIFDLIKVLNKSE
jgi:hypothetical protein